MKKNILIVHNDESVAHLIRMMLASPNIFFETKNSYEDVEQVLQDKTYDLIITDAAIKGNFIFQYLEELKLNAKDTPIIVMSQIDQEAIVRIAKKIGISEFISFPFNPAEAKNCINSYL